MSAQRAAGCSGHSLRFCDRTILHAPRSAEGCRRGVARAAGRALRPGSAGARFLGQARRKVGPPVIADHSRLYPSVLAEVRRTAMQQLCLFHATRRGVRADLDLGDCGMLRNDALDCGRIACVAGWRDFISSMEHGQASALPPSDEKLTQRRRTVKRCQVVSLVGAEFATSQPLPPPQRCGGGLHSAGRRRGSGGCAWLLHERCVCALSGSLRLLSRRYSCDRDRRQTTDMLTGRATTHQVPQVSLNPTRESCESALSFWHAVSLAGARVVVMKSCHVLIV